MDMFELQDAVDSAMATIAFVVEKHADVAAHETETFRKITDYYPNSINVKYQICGDECVAQLMWDYEVPKMSSDVSGLTVYGSYGGTDDCFEWLFNNAANITAKMHCVNLDDVKAALLKHKDFFSITHLHSKMQADSYLAAIRGTFPETTGAHQADSYLAAIRLADEQGEEPASRTN
jgi:hypothetical protein